MIKLYNTLSRQLDEFKPLHPHHVRIYTCGLTVYSQPLIGNWVTYINWDFLVRMLRSSGYEVNHVQNITDVGHLTSDEDAGEDKMLKGALREGLTAWQVAEKYMAIADHEAYDLLGLSRPTHMPRATDFIPQQIEFVKELEKKGYTYTIADGVYFDTSKLKNYAALARLDIAGLAFGARVADTGKKNPTDFAVWKLSNPHEKRDMEWESPWGKGFPGWHLECSVMARELLGDQIDIHTGGIDHIPVHHTNEIAQTEALTGKPFSQFWVHANHLKIDGTKISKSLGNGYTLKDIADKGYDLRAFKLLVLGKHYRTEGNFTWDILAASQNRLRSLQAFADLRFQTDEQYTVIADDYLADMYQQILASMQHDLNGPQALQLLGEVIDHIEKQGSGVHTKNIKQFTDFIEQLDNLFGLGFGQTSDITSEQKSLLTRRRIARQNKDWHTSDQIRDELLEQGITVRDVNNDQNGQIWSRS